MNYSELRKKLEYIMGALNKSPNDGERVITFRGNSITIKCNTIPEGAVFHTIDVTKGEHTFNAFMLHDTIYSKPNSYNVRNYTTFVEHVFNFYTGHSPVKYKRIGFGEDRVEFDADLPLTDCEGELFQMSLLHTKSEMDMIRELKLIHDIFPLGKTVLFNASGVENIIRILLGAKDE